MNWFKRGKSETINTRYLNGNLKDHPVFKDQLWDAVICIGTPCNCGYNVRKV